ncbi:MAG TPA: hypothetical protein VJ898_02445 [Natrialbaceae archaeon]|nr:hypothetical protein [Natrialbaceae archaeon]
MSRRTVIAIGIVAVVVLAGCGGATSGITETPTDDSSLTTAATPSPQPTTDGGTTVEGTTASGSAPTATPAAGLENESLPPGMSTTGVTNASALVEAHDHRVRSQGYAARTNLSMRGIGANVTTTTEQRWGRDGTFLIESSSRSSMGDSTGAFYANGTTTFVRRAVDDRTTYSAVDRGFYASQWNDSTTLAAFVSLGTFDVTKSRTSDGTTLVTLDAAGPRNTSAVDLHTTEMSLPSSDRISALDARMVVDLDGRIHSLTMNYNLSAEGSSDEVRFSVRYRLDDTGLTSVEAPSWIETAREQVTMADVTVDVRDDVVAITHRGGDAIPANASVSLVGIGNRSGDTTMVTARLESSLEPGETAYFYRPEGASGFEGRIVVGDRPTGAVAPLPDAFRLTIGRQGEVIAATVVQGIATA